MFAGVNIPWDNFGELYGTDHTFRYLSMAVKLQPSSYQTFERPCYFVTLSLECTSELGCKKYTT